MSKFEISHSLLRTITYTFASLLVRLDFNSLLRKIKELNNTLTFNFKDLQLLWGKKARMGKKMYIPKFMNHKHCGKEIPLRNDNICLVKRDFGVFRIIRLGYNIQG